VSLGRLPNILPDEERKKCYSTDEVQGSKSLNKPDSRLDAQATSNKVVGKDTEDVPEQEAVSAASTIPNSSLQRAQHVDLRKHPWVFIIVTSLSVREAQAAPQEGSAVNIDFDRAKE